MKRLLQLRIIMVSLYLTSFFAVLMPMQTIVASNVTTASVYGQILISNNNTSTFTNISSNVSGLSSTALLASGLMSTNASNVVIQEGGADIPFMPGYGTGTWMTSIPSVPGTGTDTQVIYMGNSVSGGNKVYFPSNSGGLNGNGGMTSVDAASLEPTNQSFSFVQRAYIDTSGSFPLSSYGLYKYNTGVGNPELFYYNPSSGNITFREVTLGITLSLAGISSGLHTVTISRDGANNWTLAVDGASTSVVNAGAVVNTADDWEFVDGNLVTYLVGQNFTVNGVLRQQITWQYNTTFADQSGNGNTATPTFSSFSLNHSANVAGTLVNFQPVAQAQAPVASLSAISGWLVGPNLSSGFSSNTSNVTFPLAVIFQDLSTSSGTPSPLIFVILTMFLVLTGSFVMSWTLRRVGESSNLIKLITVACLMGIAVGVGTIDYWMVLAYILICTCLVIAGSKKGWI